MSKERILLQIEAYRNKVRSDYLNNIITGFQYEMLYRELTNLIKNRSLKFNLMLNNRFFRSLYHIFRKLWKSILFLSFIVIMKLKMICFKFLN